MMRRPLALTLCLLSCFLSAGALRAATNGSELISTSVAQKYGLQRAWFTQVRMIPGREEIVDIRLVVSSKKAQTIFQVRTDTGRSYNFSEFSLNTFGEPMGVEGAGKAAAEQVRLLRLEGLEGQIEQTVVPEITLIVTTEAGMIQAIDAETGRTKWATAVGHYDYPTTSPAANEQLVAAVNGQFLYVLNAEDGSLLQERRIVGAPAAGPAIVGTRVFVPQLNGHLKSYGFGPNQYRWPDTYRANGSVEFPPIAAGNLVIWPTDVGTLTAVTAGRRGVLYRLRLGERIAGPAVFAPPNQLLAVTEKGFLYSFDVDNGDLAWRYSTGDETAQPAAIVGNTVFLVSRRKGIHAISATDGAEKWWSPYGYQFVAATKTKVYTTSKTGQLIVLDADTGSELYQIPVSPTDRLFVNNQTDRIYIGTQSGVLQCFHEQGAEWPVIHSSEVAAQPAPEAKAPVQPKVDDEPAAAPVDPFGGSADDDGSDPFE